MVTESKGTTVVAGLIHKGPTVSYRYTTLLDATSGGTTAAKYWQHKLAQNMSLNRQAKKSLEASFYQRCLEALTCGDGGVRIHDLFDSLFLGKWS